MRYFVIGDDGQKYGPADIDTLNSWIAESRLLPTQQLEDESSGVRMAAASVQGLNFPAPATQQYAPGQPYQQHYARPTYGGDDGSADVTKAWWYAVLGFLCCPFLHIAALIYAAMPPKREIRERPDRRSLRSLHCASS